MFALTLLLLASPAFAPAPLDPAPPLPWSAATDDPPTMEQAARPFQRSQWKRAAELYAEIVAADEANGPAWFRLAYCQAQLGEHAAALVSNERAIERGGDVPTATYNLACCHEVLGDLDAAEAALLRAIEAGFLDFDQIAADPELAGVRARGNLELPDPGGLETFRARNRVELPYALVLPEGHDPQRATRAVVLMGAGHGPRSAAWTVAELCDGTTRAQETLVLVIAAPERGWWTHPTHHALEELLEHVREEHAIAGGRFHLVSYLRGVAPADTYSGMSGRFFASYTALGALPHADGEYPRALRDLRVHAVGRVSDAAFAAAWSALVPTLKEAAAGARLEVVEDPSRVLVSLRHGRWLEVVRGLLDGA